MKKNLLSILPMMVLAMAICALSVNAALVNISTTTPSIQNGQNIVFDYYVYAMQHPINYNIAIYNSSNNALLTTVLSATLPANQDSLVTTITVTPAHYVGQGNFIARISATDGFGFSDTNQSAFTVTAGPADTTPPTITSVTNSSPACNVIRFTINGAADNAGGVGLHATPYSFDGGANWQAANYIEFAGTTYTINANNILVRDANNNIYTYNQAITGTAIACPGDVTPPTITSVTNSSPACNLIRFTINGAADNVALHPTAPYSFDNGATWQANNYIEFAGTTYTINANNILVRDAALNIFTYNQTITGTAAACPGDVIPPVLTIDQPLNINYNTTTVPLQITCTDNVAVSQIWYNVNNGANTTYSGATTLTLADNRSYTIFAFCNDTSNNLATATRFFSIYSGQQNNTPAINDTIAPNITINQPLAQNYNTTTVPVQITCNDDYALSSIWYNFGGANISYTGTTTAILADNTTYLMTTYCNDSMNNLATATRVFSINTSAGNGTNQSNDTIAPNITIVEPLQQNYNATAIPINITCNDNVNVSAIWYSIGTSITAILQGTNTTYTGPTTFNATPNTTYGILAFCNDTAGNTAAAFRIFSTYNNQSNNTPVIDPIGPNITINQPLAQNYNTTTIPVDITCTDNFNVSSIWYSIGTSITAILQGTNTTYTGPTTFNAAPNTTYGILAFCNDTSGNTAAAFRIFSTYNNQSNNTPVIDPIAPVLTVISPLTQNYNATVIPVSMTCTDNFNATTMWFTFNGTTYNYTVPTSINAAINQTYSFIGFCNDSAGNTVNVTRAFSTYDNQSNGTPVIDTLAPTLNVTSPTQNNYNATSIPLQITCIDNVNVSSIWYTLNNGTATSAIVPYTNATTLNLLVNHSYLIRAYCNDTSGNMAYANRTFSTFDNQSNNTPVIDIWPPIFNVSSPLQQNYNATSIPVIMDCSDNFGVATMWFVFNGTNYTYTVPTSVNVSVNQTYGFEGFCSDAAGNTVNVTRMFSTFSNQSNGTPVIDILAPTIIINSPTATTYSTTVIPIDVTCYDPGGNVTAQLYNIDGAADENYTGPINVTLANGAHSLNFRCTDASNNTATATVGFTISTGSSRRGGGGGGGGGYIAPRNCSISTTCTTWSTCTAGIQKRSCTDSCNVTRTENRSCTVTVVTNGTSTTSVNDSDSALYGPASNKIRIKKLVSGNESQDVLSGGSFTGEFLPIKAIGYAVLKAGSAKNIGLGLLILLIIAVLWLIFFLLGKRRKQQ